MTTTFLDAEGAAAKAPRLLPHLRSEVSRLAHRRLYRVLTAVLLLGIVLVSVVVFLRSSATLEVPASVQRNYDEAVAAWDRDFDSIQRGYQQCAETVPDGTSVESQCGSPPDYERDKPQLAWFMNDRRYHATLLPDVAFAVTFAAAMLAFILGASSGGAEWSSRSMTLQLLWEPRRLRLLLVKWAALAVVTAATTLVAITAALGLGASTASLRGTWDGIDEGVDQNGQAVGSFWPDLVWTSLRGVLLVAVVASFGFAIAMLVRNTGAALGAGFVYFAVVENAVRIVFAKFGPDPFLLSSNAAAFVHRGGLEVPGAQVTVTEGGGSYTTSEMVHLSNGRALVTLTVYLLVVGLPAVWSFTRRDVG